AEDHRHGGRGGRRGLLLADRAGDFRGRYGRRRGRSRGLALLRLALFDAIERLGDLAVLRRGGRDGRLQRGEIVAQLIGGGAQLRDGILQRLHLVGDLFLRDRRGGCRRG